MIVNIGMFLLFCVAWIAAQIILDVIRGTLRRKQQAKLIDDIYLKVSKLVLSSMKDLKEVAKR